MEVTLSDAELRALSGTIDACGWQYSTRGGQPYDVQGYAQQHLLARVLGATAGALRVYKDGALTFGVRAGRWQDGSTARSHAGSAANALVNNAVNYVYLTAAGTLTVNQTGFPAPSATPHLPLAAITTSGGGYAIADIVDHRGRMLFYPLSAVGGAEWEAEGEAFFNATDLTGAEAQTLSSAGNADALHIHSAAGLATVLDLTGKTISVPAPAQPNHPVTKAYADALAGGMAWQAPVKDRHLTAPPAAIDGDRYIVADGATGAWSGHDDDVAEYGGSSWSFTEPVAGMSVYVEDESLAVVFNDDAWVTSSAGGNLDSVGDGVAYIRLAGVSGLHLATASSLAADAVNKTHINADVAGSGLQQAGDGSLAAKVDATTIQVNGSGQLAVITSGLVQMVVGSAAGILPLTGLAVAHLAAAFILPGAKMSVVVPGTSAGALPSTGLTTAMLASAFVLPGANVQVLSVGVNAGVVPSAGVANAHCSTTMALARSKLAAQYHARQFGPADFRNQDLSAVGVAASGYNFGCVGGSWAAPSGWFLSGAAAPSATNYTFIPCALPAEFAGTANLDVTVRARYVTAGMMESAELDVVARKINPDGTVGADLVTTDPVEAITAAFADYEWEIDKTGLTAGDRLLIGVRALMGTSDMPPQDIHVEIASVALGHNIQG